MPRPAPVINQTLFCFSILLLFVMQSSHPLQEINKEKQSKKYKNQR
jgi:hypothetical protein